MPHHAPPHIPAPTAAHGNEPELPDESWYSTEQLARMLNLDPSTPRRWRTARPPQGPPFVRLSPRLVMYSARDVHRWLADHRIDPARAA
ncbi:helix-turn-helix transcriptional regulator [Streptomyces sp. NPDC053048]|uniref:helix-turn-helix transcriptional regulator n=1 Tax=Streptomyces sp. NPDC053048 TaxID=3365694 RepID=UPI0037D667E2